MRNSYKLLIFTLIYSVLTLCHAAEVPKGFSIELYAENVENVRQMALSDIGIIYTGSRRAGKVHAVIDSDGDFKADKTVLIAEDLNMPSGVAYKEGDLYVAEVDKILKFENIDSNYHKNPKPEVVYTNLPDKSHHGWKYIKFGPDGRLYVPIGVPCNVCLNADERFGTIIAIDLDTGETETMASGVRNSVGFDWQPESKELWFTDNGRDMMGDDIPACELNRITEAGQFFGFPYVHGKDVLDPKFSKRFKKDRPDMSFIKPAWEFQAHVAPLGMMFYQGDMFPEEYQNSIFVTQHGSWNRSKKVGYKLVSLKLNDKKEVIEQKDFITGWLEGEEVLARPNDVITLKDGSILISDDGFNKIYRVSYKAPSLQAIDL